ncbi:MAG TPA: hypothetical protein EYH08_05975, partial [Pyrodictium sp.]|nr:hypothetical protein [Pyrodictium sp.]
MLRGIAGLGKEHIILQKLLKLYRSKPIAREVVRAIHAIASKLRKEFGDEPIKIMDFCGTHEWTITQYGLRT